MKATRTHMFFTVFLMVMFAAFNCVAVTLTVEDGIGRPQDTLRIGVTIDNPAGIAGAAFTIIYDADKITLTAIESIFFDTFANQWTQFSPPVTPPDTIAFGDPPTTYFQPLLRQKSVGTGMRVSAVRMEAATASDSHLLFTLSFIPNEASMDTTYPVGIVATNLDIPEAGYGSGGEAVPLLVGSDPSQDVTSSAAFPILLASSDVIGSVEAGSVTFHIPDRPNRPHPPTSPDSDGDGIPDAWELEKFGNLRTANATSDVDQDGYTDKQEWVNKDILDPDGNTYDPVYWKNTLGGDGYDESTRIAPGDTDGDGSIDLDDVRRAYLIYQGDSYSAQEFCAANVCDDGDGHENVLFNDVRAIFMVLMGGGISCDFSD